MILSLSDSTSAQRMTQFYTAETTTLHATIPLIARHAWSPCVWTNGHRLKSNFMFADLCALDFDDGRWGIEQAKEMLETGDYAGVIGTTKSHTDEAPRFRLVMVWASRISCIKTYEQNMARLVKHLPADPAAKDAARFFWPCKDVVFYRAGAKLDWLPYQAPRAAQAFHSAPRVVPSWIVREAKAAMPGRRNKTVYWLAKRLKEIGFTTEESAKILGSYIDLDGRELHRTVLSAFTNTT